MSRAWPISFFHLPGHSDWFREEHVIQGGPVRLSPGILPNHCPSTGLAKLVRYYPGASGRHPTSELESLFVNE